MIIYQSIKELNENIEAAKEIEMAIIVLRKRLASPLSKEASSEPSWLLSLMKAISGPYFQAS